MKIVQWTLLLTIFFGACQEKEEVIEPEPSIPMIEEFTLNSRNFLYDNQFTHEMNDPFYFSVKVSGYGTSQISFVLLTVNSDTSLTKVYEVQPGRNAEGKYTLTFNEYMDDLYTIILDEPNGKYDYRNPYNLKEDDDIELTIYAKTEEVDDVLFRRVNIFLK